MKKTRRGVFVSPGVLLLALSSLEGRPVKNTLTEFLFWNHFYIFGSEVGSLPGPKLG